MNGFIFDYKRSIYLYLLIGLLIYNGCTPKVVDDIVTDNKETLPSEEEVFPKSPCTTFDDLGGAEREIVMTAYVLYKDNLKANRYKEAFSYWRQAINLAPAANGRVKYQFDDGVILYKNLFENTSDPVLKKNYVDSIYMLYDKRAYCFNEEAYVKGLKAFDGYYYFSDYFDTMTIYKWFTSHIDSKDVLTEYFVVNPFSKMLYDGVTSGIIPKEEGLHYAKILHQIVVHGVSTCKDKQCDTWNIIKGYAPVQLELLEGMEDFYDCEYYINKYIPLFKAFPDSCDIINTAFGRLTQGGCDPKGKDLLQLAEAKSKKCYVAPEAPGLARQGYDAYQQGKYRLAIQKFEQFANESNDREIKAKYYLLISKIYYGDIKNFSNSRQYARKAAEFKPRWGEPFILIGKLYASSGPLCGPGTGWDSQVVTWVAIDQFVHAKTIDPSVTSEANKLINTYSQYMPSSEDLFFRGIKKGSTYFVPCWIQEETMVRSSD